MAEEKTNTTGQGESSEPVVVQPKVATLQEKLDAYYAMTGLKLDPNCHMDMEYLSLWYETKYLTKVVYRSGQTFYLIYICGNPIVVIKQIHPSNICLMI